MSSRHQKEKRLRPQRDPYKRNQFDQSKYIGVAVPNKQNHDSVINEDFTEFPDENDYDEFE
mgnify:CR=1 FL=1